MSTSLTLPQYRTAYAEQRAAYEAAWGTPNEAAATKVFADFMDGFAAEEAKTASVVQAFAASKVPVGRVVATLSTLTAACQAR